MKTIIKTFLFLLIVAHIGCENDNDPIINGSDKLIGSWINPVYNDSELKLERAGTLKKNESMITITMNNGINSLEDINWRIKTLNDKYLIIERIQ
ncbi:MAG: hypothetical protein ACOH1N_05295 [Lutibacter sp.]